MAVLGFAVQLDHGVSRKEAVAYQVFPFVVAFYARACQHLLYDALHPSNGPGVQHYVEFLTGTEFEEVHLHQAVLQQRPLLLVLVGQDPHVELLKHLCNSWTIGIDTAQMQ